MGDLTEDENRLKEETDRSSELGKFMKEIIRQVDDIPKQPPSKSVATVQKVKWYKRSSYQNYEL